LSKECNEPIPVIIRSYRPFQSKKQNAVDQNTKYLHHIAAALSIMHIAETDPLEWH
tara:strand:+ start:164 stop:331 length:168 start_codon:yes stop_codon:yes gene_type:complete